MKQDSFIELQQENDRLKILATHDELTGILNRRATEAAVREAMPGGGTLFVCDLDGFKQINDRCGHLVGDNCLVQTAKLLQYLIRSGDILGRIGGDEFVIFAASCSDEQAASRLQERIEGRFRSFREHENLTLGISVGGAQYQEGDTYETLFDRADQALLRIKNKRRRPGTDAGTADNWLTDMMEIRGELTEQVERPGANCRDFESFKTIYRFIERCMRRDGRKACVVLISLVDSSGSAGVPFDIWEQMDLLGEIIRQTLRMGDVFTRYSTCQYLVLLIDVDAQLAEAVEARIERTFHDASLRKSVIFHHCHELRPVSLPEPPQPE